MGGATSKLKENDWEKADGKLRGSDHTVDGANATQKYSIYYLTKRGVNQREFDVTDEESNLIFTTKQVPGTIACFDVSFGVLESLMRQDLCSWLTRCDIGMILTFISFYPKGSWEKY